MPAVQRGVRFVAHCVCGDSMDVRSGFPDTTHFYERMWARFHRGEGHGPATPSQAGAIRRRMRSAG